MTSQFVTPPANMVNEVRNIVDSYGMGPFRALAQEPVQNAKDEKKGKTVRVDYQLHRRESPYGREYFLLTITDSGTGGLKGPVLPKEQLHARGYVLKDGENWAAFEGQGFTEKNEGDLGCRGQGKSAALYHSNPGGFMSDGRDRLLMLYDTLLEDGEYRMGVRYADPVDGILSPPLCGDDAKLMIWEEYEVEEGLTVSLGLDHLEQPGTRIIIPFLLDETVEAIHSGELHRWLQRCWWRAIQTGELEINVIDENGNSSTVEVPLWWKNKRSRKGGSQIREYRDIPVGDGLLIKRVVVQHDPELEADEIEGHGVQYGGVQLLRNRQWIETQGIWDQVPQEYRPGFRAYAEFDRKLEAELKASEKSQHESFNGQRKYVTETRQAILQAVKEFTEEQGWSRPAQAEAITKKDQEHAADFLASFTTSKPSKPGPNRKGDPNSSEPTYDWECQLGLQFPDPKNTRVDWGQSITGVTVTADVKPVPENRWATVSLEMTRKEDHASRMVATTQAEFLGEPVEISFGDFQIIRGQAHNGQISCPEQGEYLLRASIIHAGQRVDTKTRRIHVATDPPPPPELHPYTIAISAQNISNPGQTRVNSGDEVFVQVTIKNRTPEGLTLEVNASLEDLLICDETPVEIPGTPLGDTPNPKAAGAEHILLFTTVPDNAPESALELTPGRHLIRADLKIRGDDQVQAHASHTIFFEADPGGTRPDLPFELEAIEGEGDHPMWDLQDRPDGSQVLMFPLGYPIRHELPESRNGNRAGGRRAFLNEICAQGLLEWALDPLKNGNTSNIDRLKQGAAGDALRDRYREQLERLEDGHGAQRNEEPRQYELLKRQTVATMLRIYQESN